MNRLITRSNKCPNFRIEAVKKKSEKKIFINRQDNDAVDIHRKKEDIKVLEKEIIYENIVGQKKKKEKKFHCIKLIHPIVIKKKNLE